MKITEVKTFLMGVGNTPRNWLFVKVYTDEGITGVGESSGWPVVIKAAIDDISPMVIGEDPMNIEKIWQLLYVGMMGHGMTGVVGSGAINGIEMALWDIKGKALGTPVWNLLGGKVRDSVRVYGHAFRYKMGIDSGPDGVTVGERALELKEMGYTAVKTGQGVESVKAVEEVRKAVGDEMDIMVECGPPPWLTVKDAILVGKALEPYNVAFYEDAVAPENLQALARLQDAVDVPIAVGERHSHIWGLREHIERELVDVIQPDAGRVGGISQLKKLAAMAEAHYITVAPHSGTLGPVGEYAALHVMASIPNALALERVEFDHPVEVRGDRPPPAHHRRPRSRAGQARSRRRHHRGGHREVPEPLATRPDRKEPNRRCTSGNRARTSSNSTSSPGTADSPPCLTQGSRSYSP